MRIEAAVLRERGGPFAIEEVELSDPRDDEVVVEVRAADRPRGIDYALDTTCARSLIEEAIGTLSIGGTMALVGVAPPGLRLEIDPMWLVRGRTITGIRVGNAGVLAVGDA